MKEAKISIIVPIYNVEKEIHRCIESIIGQTLEDIEILLVNDGSPDNCPAICDEYARKDKRIRVFHKENSGLSHARNVGLKESSGEYILFVDADDYIDKCACEILYKGVEDHVDILVGEALMIDGNKEILLGNLKVPKGLTVSGKDYLKLQLKSSRMLMYVWLNIYNRRFLIDNDLFFKNGVLYEDQEWTPRVFLKAKSVKQIDFLFYYYIVRQGSITQSKEGRAMGLDMLTICYELEKVYQQLDGTELKKLLNNDLSKLFLYAVEIGEFYSNKYNNLYSKSFLLGKPLGARSKAKVCLFILNKSAYKYIHILHKRSKS